jgi:hypothetical protein
MHVTASKRKTSLALILETLTGPATAAEMEMVDV